MKKVIICLAVMALAGCVSDHPSKFYSINSQKVVDVKINSNRALNIGIDEVEVPGYLSRPQIVTVKNVNELELAEFDRWAEPLADSLQRVIAGDVAALLKKSKVRPATINRNSFDYVVSVEINKFDGKFGDKAVLDAWWIIYNKDNKAIVNERSTFETPLGATYDDLVQKQGELVNKLSVEIAKKISRLH